MSQNVTVGRIRLISGQQAVDLTPEQIVRLAEDLDDLLGSFPSVPVVVDPNHEPFPEKWDLICSAYKETPNTLNIYL